MAGNARPTSEFADAVNRNSSVARGLDAVLKEKDTVWVRALCYFPAQVLRQSFGCSVKRGGAGGVFYWRTHHYLFPAFVRH